MSSVYARMKMVAVGQMEAVEGKRAGMAGENLLVSPVGCPALNDALREGWEIIQILSHHSARLDLTGVAALMGRRASLDDENSAE